MTKKEILEKHISLYFSSHHDRSRWNGEGEHGGAEWHTDKAIAEDIFKAMDAHAKQQAIAFMNWTLQSNCQYSCTDEDQWTNINDSTDSITTEQLHHQFIEQQNNQ